MLIRKANVNDYDKVWEIFEQVIKTGDTYVFRPDTPKSDLPKLWFTDQMDTYVAEDGDEILGTYMMKPNQIDLGSHVANCGYMVHPKAQGRGIGKEMCQHSIETARANGFKAMQFNIVVSTNTHAVTLWKKFGFDIIGVVPNGFNHQQLGFVDTYIMYKTL
ncbi:MAG: GNAT family N-acetyltransferase [Bacteroidota bacterium]